MLHRGRSVQSKLPPSSSKPPWPWDWRDRWVPDTGAHRAPPPAARERQKGSRRRWVPATEGVGPLEARGSTPAACALSPWGSPQGSAARVVGEAEGDQADPGPASREGRGRRGHPEEARSASPGPHSAAETKPRSKRHGERRPRRQRRASPAGRDEALTHLRLGCPPSVQQPRRLRLQPAAARGAGEALRPRRRAGGARAAQARCASWPRELPRWWLRWEGPGAPS